MVGERTPRADSSDWRIQVTGLVEFPLTWMLDELCKRPQTDFQLDIHCVTRWSMLDCTVRGIPLLELLVEAGPLSESKFVSFVSRSERNHSTSLSLEAIYELQPIVAFALNGKQLETEHGGPVRLIVPGKYFYKSVKWLETIELLPHDRLGYWEAESGYHNGADPWREERFLASNLSRREAGELLAARDFSGRDLFGIEVERMDLSRLKAVKSLLRNANFRFADLRDADFSGANLSGADLRGANLANAAFLDADVEGADFSGANLLGADFTGSSLFGASFIGSSPTSSDEPFQAIVNSTTRISTQQIESLTLPQQDFLRSRLGHAN